MAFVIYAGTYNTNKSVLESGNFVGGFALEILGVQFVAVYCVLLCAVPWLPIFLVLIGGAVTVNFVVDAG
jgi:hypothetical protein